MRGSRSFVSTSTPLGASSTIRWNRPSSGGSPAVEVIGAGYPDGRRPGKWSHHTVFTGSTGAEYGRADLGGRVRGLEAMVYRPPCHPAHRAPADRGPRRVQ